MNASCEATLERIGESLDWSGQRNRSGEWLPRLPSVRPVRHSYHVLPTSHTSSPNKYTVKYFGVTNGQIGILSTKRLLPRLPFQQGRTQLPLPLTYASESRRHLQDKPSPIKLVKNQLHYIASQTKTLMQRRSPGTRQVEMNQDFVINRYAFPRGLVAVRKRGRKTHRNELSQQFETPKRGMSGWMLSSSYTTGEHSNTRRKSPSHSTITGELYLKHLQMQGSNNVD